MYDASSEARKSTALATSSGSPQRASGTVEEKRSETFADSSAVALARTPRFQIGVFVTPAAAFRDKKVCCGQADAAVASGNESPFACELHDSASLSD